MKKFKLYLLGRHTICLSQFDSTKTIMPQNSYGTFGEELSQGENDQYQLTFSMYQYIGLRRLYNHYLDLMPIGSFLRLVIDDNSWIELIITDRNPNFSSGNVAYSFTAQDTVSFLWPKRGIGYSYSSFDDDGELHSIDYYGKRILIDNGLLGWDCVSDLSLLTGGGISFEVSDSNAYNALVELANSVNAKIKVNYQNHTISFFNKQDKRFSGYRFYPQKNLKTYNVNFSGSELTTVLKCSGGEDETGALITIVPAIPDCVFTWMNEFREKECLIGEEDIGKWADKTAFPADWYDKIQTYILEHDGYFLSAATELVDGKLQKTEEWKEEEKELDTFTKIADKVPYLGQYLVDFSYFCNTKQLSTAQWNDIDDTLNVKMRKNNIDYKYYTSLYYRTQYEISSLLEKARGVAEEYEALWVEFYNFTEEDKEKKKGQYENLSNEILARLDDVFSDNDNYLCSLCSKMYGAQYGKKSFDAYTQYGDAAIEYKKLAEEAEKKLEKLKEKIDPEKKDLSLDSEIALLEKQCFNYSTLADKWTITVGEESISIQGINGLLEDKFETAIDTLSVDHYKEGIDFHYVRYKSIDDGYWSDLLTKYNSFFYESSYENSDELDSISLYNQAVSYFYDIKNPTASYNIEVIDLSALDLIGMPNLEVGSTIQICDERLGVQPQDSLIITDLKTVLRKPSSVSVSVEHYVPYQRILSKLIKTVSNK